MKPSTWQYLNLACRTGLFLFVAWLAHLSGINAANFILGGIWAILILCPNSLRS